MQRERTHHANTYNRKAQTLLLTGAIGGGKTTQMERLINSLRRKDEPWKIFPEISRELQTLINPETKEPVYNPSQDPNTFTNAILERRIDDYDFAVQNRINIYDRGLIDSLAFCRAYGGKNEDQLLQLCQQKPYDLIIFFPFWEEIYEQDDGRCETPTQAKYISNHIHKVLLDLNVNFTTIPKDTPEARHLFVLQQIRTISPHQRLL